MLKKIQQLAVDGPVTAADMLITMTQVIIEQMDINRKDEGWLLLRDAYDKDPYENR